MVMGIVNVTPDSFFEAARTQATADAIARGRELFAAGVDVVDIGGESTRPRSQGVDAATEEALLHIVRDLVAAGMPVLMLAVIVVRASVSPAAQDMDDVSTDGRRTALLKLIDGGRGVDTLLSGHETALFDAVRHGDEKLVAELLGRGAKVNAQNSAGNTPLLLAVSSGRNELARVLLDRGALVNTANGDGRTPLMLAAMRGNAALVHLLLDRGANVTRADTHGKTAAAYADAEGYPEISRLLSQNPK